MGAIFGGISLTQDSDIPSMDRSLAIYDQFKFCDKMSYTEDGVYVNFFQHTIKGNPYDSGLYYNNNTIIIMTGIIDVDHAKSKALYVCEQYEELGIEFIKGIEGDFAFVIYDKTKKMIYMSRDHLGKVMLYYTIYNNCLFFSTLIKPLLLVRAGNNSINKTWASIYTSIDINLHSIEDEVTIYKDISIVKIAHYLEVTAQGIRKICFWNPLNIKTKKTWDKKTYLEEFNDVFSNAVSKRIRSVGNIGISLSGGLDSTTTIAYAADILKKNNKVIYAYSSIPSMVYIDRLSGLHGADESEYINDVVKTFENVIHKYTSSESYNSYNLIDRILGLYECPYKVIANSPYVLDIVELAKKDGCSVLLNGGHGNLTISRGCIEAQLTELIRRFRFVQAFRDAANYCKNYQVGRRLFLKHYLSLLVGKFKISKHAYLNHLVIGDIKSQRRIHHEIKKKFPFLNTFFSSKKYHEFMLNPCILNQMAEFETKLSLETGVFIRDPTRDQKLIEFLLQLPYSAFCEDGIERSLVINAMQNKLPNKILTNFNARGIQSADWILRIEREWDHIRDEISCLVSDDAALDYINKEELRNLINKYPYLRYEECNILDIKQLMMVLILSKHESMFNLMERR